jgi:hypothetical protein
MIRRTALIGAALVLALIGISATGGTAHAAIPNGLGVGITNCNAHWSGTMSFSPLLVTGGTATSETITLVAAEKPCTGGTPVPAAMKIKGVGTISGPHADDCNSFFLSPPPGPETLTFSPTLAGAIAWTPTSITASHYSFPSATITDSLPTAPVVFKATGITVTGSYPTTAGKIKFKSVATLSSIETACGTGLGAIDIAAAGSVGKF